MKTTIPIHGIPVEFSDERPTKPGAYWHTMDNGQEPYIVTVTEKYGNYAIEQLHIYKGLWSTSPLVPAVEVGSAFTEGHMAGVVTAIKGGTCLGDWSESRASKIVEGTL